MKKNRYILAGLTAAMMLATACSEIDEDQSAQEQTVPVTFYLRSAGPNTRATEDIKAGTEAENAIHTAKVWLYQSAYTDAQSTEHAPLLLGYQDATFSDNAGEREITINIPKSVADAGRKLDVYAVANAASVGLGEMNAGSNEGTNSFDNVYLAGTNFTPQTLTASPGVPTDGLPMSQIAKNKEILGSATQYTLNKIDLVRAISKIRFAFARPTGMQDVEITGIEIDGNLIPNQERIFPLQNTDNYAKVGDIQFNGDRYTNINKTGTAPDYAGTYISDVMRYGSAAHNTTLISTANIFEHVWPKWFSIDYAGVTGKTYEERIDSLLQASNYDFTTYLRESDKPITGTIYYRYGSTETTQSAKFTMPAPIEGQGPDFARNHIYTVYGHFKNGELCLTLTVNPWELKEATIDYKDHPSVSSPLTWIEDTYDTDQRDATNHTYNLTMKYQTTAECKFTIGTPKGFFWTASFSSVSGDPEAFKFVTVVDGEETLVNTISGYIDGNPSTIKIKTHIDDDVPQINTATLHIVVRGIGGKDIPVDYLNTGDYDVYTLIQRANI